LVGDLWVTFIFISNDGVGRGTVSVTRGIDNSWLTGDFVLMIASAVTLLMSVMLDVNLAVAWSRFFTVGNSVAVSVTWSRNMTVGNSVAVSVTWSRFFTVGNSVAVSVAWSRNMTVSWSTLANNVLVVSLVVNLVMNLLVMNLFVMMVGSGSRTVRLFTDVLVDGSPRWGTWNTDLVVVN
jgi:hypothetical protein